MSTDHDAGSEGDRPHLLPTTLTAPEIATLKSKATGWQRSNPFRARLLARLGGLHRPPATPRESDTEEARIAHARDVAEATEAGGCDF